jgi:hypothetical protein
MAIFGRRQPHAPIILVGSVAAAPPPTPPIGVVVVAGQKTAQFAANCYFRRSFTPVVIKRGGPPASTARHVIAGQRTSQQAASRYFRRQFPPIIKVGGPPPSTAHLLIAGQKTSQLTADRYFRRQFPPIIKKGGPAGSVAHSLVVSKLPLPRPSRRPVYISQAPPPPVAQTAPIGALVVAGQKASQLTADRYFRRSFAPIVKRAGGPTLAPSRLVQVRAPSAYRPARRPVFVGQFTPPVVTRQVQVRAPSAYRPARRSVFGGGLLTFQPAPPVVGAGYIIGSVVVGSFIVGTPRGK